MPLSLDFHTLRCAYSSGEATPAAIVREVISRVERRGDDAVWISRIPGKKLLDEAAALKMITMQGGVFGAITPSSALLAAFDAA